MRVVNLLGNRGETRRGKRRSEPENAAERILLVKFNRAGFCEGNPYFCSGETCVAKKGEVYPSY